MAELYVCIPVTIYEDERLLNAGLSAAMVWHRAMAFSKKQLSDGRIAPAQLPFLLATEDDVAALVRAGLFVAQDDGSWFMPDYSGSNKPRVEIERIRELDKQRKAKYRDASKDAGGTPNATPDATPDGTRASLTTTTTTGESVVVVDATRSATPDTLADLVQGWHWAKGVTPSEPGDALYLIRSKGISDATTEEALRTADRLPSKWIRRAVELHEKEHPPATETPANRTAQHPPPGPDCANCDSTGWVYPEDGGGVVECPECHPAAKAAAS